MAMDISIFPIIGALVMSIIIHEVAHGFMANWLGDPTARLAGRLTLNPIPHIDLFGSIILPALLVMASSPLMFGYAKPVPYNPYNLRNQKWGDALVAFAGPGVNLTIAIIFAIILRIAGEMGANTHFLDLASYIVYINILLALFNLIPIPPTDGSKVILPFLPRAWEYRYREFGERLGLMGMVLLVGFVFVFGKQFYALVQGVFSLLTGSLFWLN